MVGLLLFSVLLSYFIRLKLSFWIAKRYLFSSRLPVALNLISALSVVGVAFGAALLLVVLSVFNGFYFLIRDFYAPYDPDFRISPKTGKYITLSQDLLDKIRKLPNVETATYSVEGRAIIKYDEKQRIIRLKGVTQDYIKVTDIDTLVAIGQYGLKMLDGRSTVVMGSGVAYSINANVADWRYPLELFTVSAESDLLSSDPENALLKEFVFPAGIFNKQAEYDNQYVLSDFELAQNLFEANGKISFYELRLKDDDALEQTRSELKKIVGPNFKVESWYEQHETLYQVLVNEKIIGYLVIAFMMTLISFNIVGALTMIVIEKKKDIGILRTMGASESTIRNIFLWEGMCIGGVGGIAGLILGGLFCYLQENYKILRFNVDESSNLLVDSFPIAISMLDFGIVFATVFVLSILSGYFPAGRASETKIVDCLKK